MSMVPKIPAALRLVWLQLLWLTKEQFLALFRALLQAIKGLKKTFHNDLNSELKLRFALRGNG